MVERYVCRIAMTIKTCSDRGQVILLGDKAFTVRRRRRAPGFVR
jgi:hypothetical protein